MKNLLKRTLGVIFALLPCLSISVIASSDGPDEIPLRPIYEENTRPRSIEFEVTASIDGKVVTVSFSELTASQIVVTDSADLTVFNQTYTPAYSAQADLSLLPSGNYTLYIYAQGYGLYGSFLLQ